MSNRPKMFSNAGNHGKRAAGSGPQMQINIDTNTLTKLVCGQCGGDRFSQSVTIRHLPALQSPNGRETVIFQPAGIVCNSCNALDDAINEKDYIAIQKAHRKHQQTLEEEDLQRDDPASSD